jgi:hypothetical protein
VEVWFTIGIADRSAFHLTMANAAMLFDMETGTKSAETTESTKYYTASLRSINKRLQDPVDGISEGVIGTVLGFACHDVSGSIRASISKRTDYEVAYCRKLRKS